MHSNQLNKGAKNGSKYHNHFYWCGKNQFNTNKDVFIVGGYEHIGIFGKFAHDKRWHGS
jgi:hypothetical protein